MKEEIIYESRAKYLNRIMPGGCELAPIGNLRFSNSYVTFDAYDSFFKKTNRKIPLKSIKWIKRNFHVPKLLPERLTICQEVKGTEIRHFFKIRRADIWLKKLKAIGKKDNSSFKDNLKFNVLFIVLIIMIGVGIYGFITNMF